MIPEPQLDSAKFLFTQDGNTLGTTDEVELLEIRLETAVPDEEPFIVLKTQGWSINDTSELDDLVARCIRCFRK